MSLDPSSRQTLEGYGNIAALPGGRDFAMSGFDSGSTGRNRPFVVRTLLIIDMVGSTRMVEALGDVRAAEIFEQHDRRARRLLRQHGGLEIDRTDGFLLLFERPLDATRYALEYHETITALGTEMRAPIAARAGIHLGEVLLRENLPEEVARGAKPVEVEGLTKLMAARAMALGGAGQTLLTRAAFDLARRASVGLAPTGPELAWRVHGHYRFAGVEEPVEICEVGVAGVAPLVPPADTEKAHRLEPRGRRSAPGGVRLRAAASAMLMLAGVGALIYWPRVDGTGRPRAERSSEVAPPVPPVGPVHRRPSVAVLGFKNLSGQENTRWLSTAVSEMLTTELGAGEQLRMESGESVSRVKHELGVPMDGVALDEALPQLRLKMGTDITVEGHYMAMPASDELLLTLKARSAAGGPLYTVTEKGSLTGIIPLVARAGSRLRAQLVSDGGSQEPPPAPARPANAEALRLYSEGLIGSAPTTRRPRGIASSSRSRRMTTSPWRTPPWRKRGPCWATTAGRARRRRRLHSSRAPSGARSGSPWRAASTRRRSAGPRLSPATARSTTSSPTTLITPCGSPAPRRLLAEARTR